MRFYIALNNIKSHYTVLYYVDSMVVYVMLEKLRWQNNNTPGYDDKQLL